MAAIREAAVEHLAFEPMRDGGAHHDGAERDGGGREPLGKGHEVGPPCLAMPLPSEPLATSPEGAHYFVGDEQHLAFARDLSKRRPVAVRWNDSVAAGVGFHQYGGDTGCAFRIDAFRDRLSRADAAVVPFALPNGQR